MSRERPLQAVIFDVDGVLTRTASLHERAWKEMFDELLGQRGQRPFTSADYRAHVDGKPRYQGVADFLSSRGVELERGDPGDDPERETVCGLGNRKNRLFLQLLDAGGVEVFVDAIDALERWRRGGMRVAAVSASRNSRRVLEAVDLARRFDVIIDGEVAARRGLDSKREILIEAARQLEVAPGDAVIIEDATAGVRAGLEARFGLVVGVARSHDGSDLREAGAHQVVDDVYQVRFVRRLPDALERVDELASWRGDRPLAIFCDFDGTLAPIVEDPAAASISGEMRAALQRLDCPVAIISGRDRADLEARARVDGIYYAGNHGFDIAGRGVERIHPEAEEAAGDVDRAERELSSRLGAIAGVIIERKRYSVAVHFRQVESESAVEEVVRAVGKVHEQTGLRERAGKKVLELEPAVDWDKGRALRWLVDVLAERSFVVYIGDDETDEDAFDALRDAGAGVYVGPAISASLADYRVADPGEVLRLLDRLAQRAG